MEVAHVEAVVGLAIQPQDLLHLRNGRLTGGGQLPPVVQAELFIGRVAGPPAPQTAGIDAENVGGLDPGHGPTQRAQNHFLTFHRPLHGGRHEREHRHLLGYRCLYAAAPAKRTFHVHSGADRSCAPYSSESRACSIEQAPLSWRPWSLRTQRKRPPPSRTISAPSTTWRAARSPSSAPGSHDT